MQWSPCLEVRTLTNEHWRYIMKLNDFKIFKLSVLANWCLSWIYRYHKLRKNWKLFRTFLKSVKSWKKLFQEIFQRKSHQIFYGNISFKHRNVKSLFGTPNVMSSSVQHFRYRISPKCCILPKSRYSRTGLVETSSEYPDHSPLWLLVGTWKTLAHFRWKVYNLFMRCFDPVCLFCQL